MSCTPARPPRAPGGKAAFRLGGEGTGTRRPSSHRFHFSWNTRLPKCPRGSGETPQNGCPVAPLHVLYLYWKFVPLCIYFLQVRTSPPFRSTFVLGFYHPYSASSQTCKKHTRTHTFLLAGAVGRGGSCPLKCGRPSFLKARDPPSRERPSYITESLSPTRNTIAGVGVGGETLLFGVFAVAA